MQGVLLLKPGVVSEGSTENGQKIVRLWVHEVYRVFYDRLINEGDREMFFKMVKVLHYVFLKCHRVLSRKSYFLSKFRIQSWKRNSMCRLQGRKNETLHSCAVQSTNSSRRALLIGGVNVLCTTYIVLKLVYVNEEFFPLLFSLICCEKRVWSVSQLSKPFWCCYYGLICKFNFTQFWMQLLDVGENDCMHSISLSGFDRRRVWRVNIRRNWMRCFPTSWRTRLKASPTTTSGVWCLEIICPRARRKSFTMKYSTLMTSER